MRTSRAQSDIVFLCVTGTPQIEQIVYGENGIARRPRAKG